MSFKKTGSHYDKNLKEWLEHFEAEYESDLSALPEANPGSTCLVKETGKTVVMANNGVWGGGSGGGLDLAELEKNPLSGKYVEGMGYSDKAWVTVVPEQTVTVAEDGSATTNTVNSIAVGNSARIVWNGTAFDCVAFELDGMPVVGNRSIADAGDDTGEPFLIGFQGNTAMIFAASTGDNVIAVTAESEIIHPIDKKYLNRKVITVTTDTSGYYNPPPVSMTFDDAFAAYETGFELVLVVEVFKGDLTTKVSDGIYTLVRVDYDRDKALIFQHFSGSTSRVATYSEENGLSFMDYNFAT